MSTRSSNPEIVDEVKTKNENPPVAVMQYEDKTIGNNWFVRSHGVTPGVLQCLQKTFRGWKFLFGERMDHSHPIGATERAICEELAYRKIMRLFGDKVNITDIGGNANRHLTAGRSNVHSCNPLLSSSDAVRRRSEFYLPGANRCENTAQTCQFHPDVYLSVHSLYYLGKDDVLDLVHRSKKGMLFAVVHRFDDLYGGFHKSENGYESRYSVSIEDDKPVVHMKVNGNCVGYTHSPCHWLARNYHQSGGRAIAWDGEPIGDSWIYRFTTAKPGLSVDEGKPMPLVQSLDRNDYYGNVDGVLTYGDQAKFRPVLGYLKITKSRFVSLGSYNMVIGTKSKNALVPKDIVKQIALDMVGRPRDSTTLRLCVDKMKSALKKIDMPLDMKITCATYGAALAFIYSLQDEIHAFNNLCRPRLLRMYDSLARAMKLENFVCCSSATLAQVESDSSCGEETRMSYDSDRSSVPSPMFDAALAWPNGLPGYESDMPLKTLKQGAWLRPHNDEEDNKVFAGQFHPNCITFSNYIPLVPTASKNNEMRALNNRALVETPSEDSAAWVRVHRHSRSLLREIEEVEGSYDNLFCNWNEKFPEAQRKRHVEAYCKLKSDGLLPEDFKMQMFVKRELTLKGGTDPEPFDPRAIQGCSDKLNVAYGPFIWHASKRLSDLWGLGNRICYASGRTAEELGEWRKQFDSDMEITIVELDESRYDAHQGFGCHHNGRILKDMTGLAKYKYAAQVESHIFTKRGSSRHFSYSVDGTMTSGKADTSFANTFANGSKLDALMIDFGFRKSEYKMVVNGDDSLVVIRKGLSANEQERLKVHLVEGNRKLGFTSKCKVRTEWFQVEFCSSLFWPVEGGYVLGPKIGRRLPKLGFNLERLDPVELDGMLLGLSYDTSYIPVLAEYVNACRKLAPKIPKNQKMKNYYKNKEYAYQIHATRHHTPTLDTDVFFEARYELDSNFARDIMTNTLKPARSITACVDFPLMEVFTKVDV